jgi:hydrogenase maturation protease
MTSASAKTVVIGVGNEYRGDDGAGRAVARLLREQLPPEVALLEESGEGTALIEAWRGASLIILIDAVHSVGAPGTIHRIDASSAPVPTALFPCSTHAFGVAAAIDLARALHELPPRVVIYGIEAASFDQARALSDEVQRAVTALPARILEELRAPSPR